MKVMNRDRVKVGAFRSGGVVGIDVLQSDEAPVYVNATPAQARKLARKLLAAADEIDPPAIAPTHWAAEPSATDAATLAPIIAKDEPAAPYVPQVGDVVEVVAGDRDHFFAVGTRGVVEAVNEFGDGAITVRSFDDLTQWVDPAALVPADAPDVDPAEPRGGCCGGGSRYAYLDGDYPC